MHSFAPAGMSGRCNHHGNHSQGDENDIAGHSHPFEKTYEAFIQVVKTPSMPVTVVHYIPDLKNAAGEKTPQNHQGKAKVKAPTRIS